MSFGNDFTVNGCEKAKCVNTGAAVKMTIGWENYLVPRYRLAQLVEILGDIYKLDSKNELAMITYTIAEAPDLQYEQLKNKAMEEVKDTLIKEKEQYSKYWLDERAKTAKLEKELREANDKLQNVQKAFTPPEDELPL